MTDEQTLLLIFTMVVGGAVVIVGSIVWVVKRRRPDHLMHSIARFSSEKTACGVDANRRRVSLLDSYVTCRHCLDVLGESLTFQAANSTSNTADTQPTAPIEPTGAPVPSEPGLVHPLYGGNMMAFLPSDDLRDRVVSALERGIENGYDDIITGDVWVTALSLQRFEVDLEHETVKDMVPHIEAFVRAHELKTERDLRNVGIGSAQRVDVQEIQTDAGSPGVNPAVIDILTASVKEMGVSFEVATDGPRDFIENYLWTIMLRAMSCEVEAGYVPVLEDDHKGTARKLKGIYRVFRGFTVEAMTPHVETFVKEWRRVAMMNGIIHRWDFTHRYGVRCEEGFPAGEGMMDRTDRTDIDLLVTCERCLALRQDDLLAADISEPTEWVAGADFASGPDASVIVSPNAFRAAASAVPKVYDGGFLVPSGVASDLDHRAAGDVQVAHCERCRSVHPVESRTIKPKKKSEYTRLACSNCHAFVPVRVVEWVKS